jgi:hypothetical protein
MGREETVSAERKLLAVQEYLSGACLAGLLNERRIRFLNIGVGLFLICFGLSMIYPLARITALLNITM